MLAASITIPLPSLHDTLLVGGGLVVGAVVVFLVFASFLTNMFRR